MHFFDHIAIGQFFYMVVYHAFNDHRSCNLMQSHTEFLCLKNFLMHSASLAIYSMQLFERLLWEMTYMTCCVVKSSYLAQVSMQNQVVVLKLA